MTCLLLFDLGELGDTPFVATTLEGSGEERRKNFFGQSFTHNSRTHRQDVGVVVCARHPGRVEVVTKCSSDSANLVCSELFSLSASPQHDAEIGLAVTYLSTNRGANRRIVATLGGVSAKIIDIMALVGQHLDQVLLQGVSGVVGADRDAGHGTHSSRGPLLPT